MRVSLIMIGPQGGAAGKSTMRRKETFGAEGAVHSFDCSNGFIYIYMWVYMYIHTHTHSIVHFQYSICGLFYVNYTSIKLL